MDMACTNAPTLLALSTLPVAPADVPMMVNIKVPVLPSVNQPFRIQEVLSMQLGRIPW